MHRCWRTFLLLMTLLCGGIHAPAMAAASEHRAELLIAADVLHVADAADAPRDSEPRADRDAVSHHHCSIGLSETSSPQPLTEQLSVLAPIAPAIAELSSLSASPLTEPPSA